MKLFVKFTSFNYVHRAQFLSTQCDFWEKRNRNSRLKHRSLVRNSRNHLFFVLLLFLFGCSVCFFPDALPFDFMLFSFDVPRVLLRVHVSCVECNSQANQQNDVEKKRMNYALWRLAQRLLSFNGSWSSNLNVW